MERVNPIIKADFPDPDVIRVEDTYYMISTTMHFMPGGVILRSYDLINWEIAGYLFDKLEGTSGERLEGEHCIYGKGMWTACLRFYKGTFYASFVAYETGKTYLFTAKKAEGPWKRGTIRGFYYDSSLLFDEDGRVYIVHGRETIEITELSADLAGPKEGGLHRILIEDKEDAYLRCEGSHIYKINGKYYLFVIRWPKEAPAIRTQMCFMSDSLEGEFSGTEVLRDDRGYFNQGVAQGGIVDSPDGNWYAVLFQDHGAVGRIPVLVPVTWENDRPVFGAKGRVPDDIITRSLRPEHICEPVYTSDDFRYKKQPDGTVALKKQWQWNHEPDHKLWRILKDGGLGIRTGKLSMNLTQAANTLTQRMMWPESAAAVTVDASGLKEGDFAGICALQGCYGMVGIMKSFGSYFLVVVTKPFREIPPLEKDSMPGTMAERTELAGPVARLKIRADFADIKDTIKFYYLHGTERKRWKQIGKPHKAYFGLDHFTGCRYGLCVYSTEECGGEAVFTDFVYEYKK